ncbi:MAG: ATP-binding cassette, subfamily bacterial [Acidimicrobiaceae bacterium]|nr:ATP-binding cassette, subfamily bacterial [Acidimicrobiaceae bacterium]
MPVRDQASARRGWRLLRQAVGEQKKAVAIGVVVGLMWTAAKVAVPSLAQRGIDEGIIRGRHGALVKWGVIIVAVGAVQAVSTGLRRWFAFGVAWRAETGLRHRLFAHLQRLHFAFHDNAQTGQLMSRAASDLQQIQSFIVMIPITMANFMTVGLVTVVLVMTNAKLALLALGALPLLNIAAKRFSSRIHPVSLGLQQELASLATVVEETITGIRAVKGFGAEPIQAERMHVRTGKVFDQSMLAARIRATFTPVLDFLPALGLAAVLWYGGHQVLDGHLTIGQLVAFTAYVNMLIWPLRSLGMIIAQGQRAVAGAQRIDEVLAAEPAIVNRPGARPLPPGGGEVRFEGVRFAYQEGALPVLKGLDLSIRPGEAVAVVGQTASGKSTIARLIPRFYDVDAGRITIDGVDIRDVQVDNLRSAVGLVFEDTFLFSDTVRANIAFAEPGAPFEQVRRAAELAGAHQFIANLPDGYETELGERGFSLSGGQRQRLALARAILADPRVLILDDATSAVDPTKEHEIRAALATVMEGRTTIVIAHRPATIALADRVVLLDEGRIVAEGGHEELLATSERYREVLARVSAEAGAATTVEVG